MISRAESHKHPKGIVQLIQVAIIRNDKYRFEFYSSAHSLISTIIVKLTAPKLFGGMNSNMDTHTAFCQAVVYNRGILLMVFGRSSPVMSPSTTRRMPCVTMMRGMVNDDLPACECHLPLVGRPGCEGDFGSADKNGSLYMTSARCADCSAQTTLRPGLCSSSTLWATVNV